MGKSSSSRKKERSKTSSSQRIRRKSRSSRKLKSKKLRHRHDSPSCSDTDFESSTSVSYSGLEDDEKVARSRSKTRKNVKPSKKRAKKRSHGHGSRDCSPHPRKRKRSKRNDRCEEKKTNKKKRRTDVSVSVTSSDSLSRATCGDGSATSNEGEIDKRRGRSGKRKGNSGNTERSRYRSKSHSPCFARSGGSDHQNEVEDDSYVENNFRRLRSVIVVVGEENKLETFDGHGQQEEITHQPDDDHPYFGDMECKDGASERELDFVTSKEAPEVENKKEMVLPDSRNSMVVKDDGVQHEGSNDNHGRVANGNSLNERKNGCSGNSDSINCIDLESILRQRALENLRKFKGVPPRNVETPGNCKVDNNNDVKQLYSPVSKSVHVTSPRDDAKINGKGFSRQGGENAVNSMIVEENGVKYTDAIDSVVSSMHDPVYSSRNLGKISNGSNGKGFLRQGGENAINSMIVEQNGVKSTDAIDLAVASMHDPVYSSRNLGKISNGSNGKGFSNQGEENAVNSLIVEENGVKSTDAIDSAVACMHNPVYSSRNLGKISNGSNATNELKQDISSLDQEVVNDSICQKADADICSTTNKSNLVIAALSPESKVDSLTKQASASQQSIQTKPSISDIGVDETAQTQTQMRNNDDQNIGNGFGSSAHKPSSSLNSISGEHSLNKSGHESGEGSQFEQKTMSVMRGGEMVQVNYKVYIPKRAPALTRRQLKR